MRTRDLALASGALFLLALHGGAQAAKLQTLYTFTGGNDGKEPLASLTLDGGGNLYGTTYQGGANGCGTVFKLAPDGTFTVLHTFAGNDGENPAAGLHLDGKGNLYGTATYGGAYGLGVAYEITARGKEKILHSFASGSDGAVPVSDLIEDGDHNIYGTTAGGGAHGYGTVFQLAPDGTETILHSFGWSDGATPNSGLVRDNGGNLYGTTISGGKTEFGTVYKLAPDGTETVLYSFGCGSDGCEPEAGLKRDSAGNLYGTTTVYTGNIFELAPDGTFTTLYSFTGGGDGSETVAGLIGNSKGTILYGTTVAGGTEQKGVVFELANGSERVLHSFTGGADGSAPKAGLVADKAGNLYGTTTGGTHNAGTIFRVSQK